MHDSGTLDFLLNRIRELDIQTRILDVELALAEPRDLSFLAAPAFRGLLGTMLREREPDLFQRFFKPGAGSHEQSGFAIRMKSVDSVLPVFRIVSFAGSKAHAYSLASDIAAFMPGMALGESVIRAVRTAGPFPPASVDPSVFEPLVSASFSFETPMRIKRHGRIVNHHQFSLAFLASAAVERLNALSAQFAGGGPPLDPVPFIAAAALSLQVHRNISTTPWSRLSESSGHKIVMDGCTGSFSYDCLSPALAVLLDWAARVNLGRHTVAGAGAFSVRFSKGFDD